MYVFTKLDFLKRNNTLCIDLKATQIDTIYFFDLSIY